MVNGSKLLLLFLSDLFTVKHSLISLEKWRRELLDFFVAQSYLKGKGTSPVTVTPVPFYKLRKGWKEKLSRVSSSHFCLDSYSELHIIYDYAWKLMRKKNHQCEIITSWLNKSLEID